MTCPRDKLNPEKKPLEELSIVVSDDGVQKKVPALSPHFAGDRPMTPFLLPPSMNDNGSFDMGAKEEWFHKMEIFKANVEWLLGLPHHKFWSQIVYGKKTWDTIISYLQEAYPFFAIHHLPNDYEIRERYNEISYLVFCIICRVSTQKESEDAWIGKSKYCELLYDCTIISLPLLFDICIVFGKDNKDEVYRIITNVFTIQPLYKEDLDSAEKHLRHVLNTVEDKFLMSHIKPPDPVNGKDSKMGISDLYDLSFYVLDTIATLYSFLDVYSEGAMILHMHTFEVSLAQFYDKVYPNLVKKLQDFVSLSHPSYESLLFTINQSRVYVLKLFYTIIQSCLNVIIENRYLFPEELLKFNAESLLNVICECMKTAKSFMLDYQKAYPLEQDMDTLSQVYPDINNDKFKSVLYELKTNFGLAPPVPTKPPKNSNITHPQKQQNGDVHDDRGSSSKTLSDDEVSSLISEVKDILPHLGEGFIMKCLEHYKFKSSDVVNAILENALPDDLQLLDPELPIIPPEPGVTDEKGDVLSRRVNVFDNDEFDVMSHDHIDTSKIHRGKRKDAKDVSEILDDKSFREELRNQFSKLGIVEAMDDVYDDEYDDTYDDRAVPVEEEEGEAERKFVVPRVLQQQTERGQRGSGRGTEEPSEEEDEGGSEFYQRPQNGFVPFAENPEAVRARREQARLSKQRGPPPPQRNVVGNARGQGQEADVLKNRNKKASNKSSYGNHNRKKGAQFKRSQGFIPS